MISLAHIINPTQTDEISDLHIAQPITFESMRMAHQFSEGVADVKLYAIQDQDETRIPLPSCFRRVRDLTRSVMDIKTFNIKRKLPLLKDILDALFETADHADYLIYTNVDIALQPYFYRTVSAIIAQGYDAFVTNRRTIPGHYKNTKDIPLMFAEVGAAHPGWDCFIFKRDLYPHFRLGWACIGIDWIGRIMIANLAPLAKRFTVFKDLHITFHIGDERAWGSDDFSDYTAHNMEECRKTLVEFDKEYGPFDRKRLPGRFLAKFEEQ